MKGLLIKDYYCIRKSALIMIAMGLFYVVFGMLESIDSSILFSLFLFLFLAVLPGTIISMEEKSHWNEYGIMLPLSRAQMVIEKYILAVINAVIAAVLFVVLNLILQTMGLSTLKMSQIFGIMWIGIAVGLLAPSFSLPWMFALGTAKGRIFAVISIAFWGIMLGGASAFVNSQSSSIMVLMSLGQHWTLLLLAGAVLCFLLSLSISILVYQRRQL